MSVVFYVDPSMAKDPDGNDQHHHAVLHVLSATRAARPVADSTPPDSPKQIY